MRPLEEAAAAELEWLLRAGAPPRAVRLTVRELVVARMGEGALGPREVSGAVEAVVRVACRLVREMSASEEMVEAVCRAALEAVRGHGGESARWLPEATSTVSAVIDELARERLDEPTWRWLTRRVPGW